MRQGAFKSLGQTRNIIFENLLNVFIFDFEGVFSVRPEIKQKKCKNQQKFIRNLAVDRGLPI